jgi:hypothetical protein
MSTKTEWTPYGLEAIRIRYLRRRRALAVIIALGLCGLWLFMFQTTTQTQTDIFVNGERQGNGISIEEPNKPKDGPITVAVDPGRVTRAESSGPTSDTPLSRTSAPVFSRAPPVPYQAYVFMYGPFLLLALAAYFLAKKRGKYDQVNFGIYKGAMPLELVSASQSKNIFTNRMARSGLFGKRRVDHLPEEIILAEPARKEA